jgi:stage II sporulation protein B
VTEPGNQLKTFLVQGGVFSSEDAARQIQKKIIEKQVPAEIFKLEESYYLFLGSAESLAASKELALFLKSYDVDVYWKEINFEAAGTSQEDEKTLDKMKAVYASLAETSATKLRGKAGTVNGETLKKNMDELKAGKLSPAFSKMNDDLTAAAKSIDEYESSKNEEKLFQAQESLLNFLLNYQNISS